MTDTASISLHQAGGHAAQAGEAAAEASWAAGGGEGEDLHHQLVHHQPEEKEAVQLWGRVRAEELSGELCEGVCDPFQRDDHF